MNLSQLLPTNVIVWTSDLEPHIKSAPTRSSKPPLFDIFYFVMVSAVASRVDSLVID